MDVPQRGLLYRTTHRTVPVQYLRIWRPNTFSETRWGMEDFSSRRAPAVLEEALEISTQFQVLAKYVWYQSPALRISSWLHPAVKSTAVTRPSGNSPDSSLLFSLLLPKFGPRGTNNAKQHTSAMPSPRSASPPGNFHMAPSCLSFTSSTSRCSFITHPIKHSGSSEKRAGFNEGKTGRRTAKLHRAYPCSGERYTHQLLCCY